MRRLLLAMIFSLAALPARAEDDIVLRQMGSFHLGGRVVEISGKPVREVLLGAGGVPARFDPNGPYQVEQMYVQYFLPEIGITGNSHMLMMDTNNAVTADLIQQWLAGKGLVD